MNNLHFSKIMTANCEALIMVSFNGIFFIRHKRPMTSIMTGPQILPLDLFIFLCFVFRTKYVLIKKLIMVHTKSNNKTICVQYTLHILHNVCILKKTQF